MNEFFSRERRYIVPLFQRSFVWGANSQCKQLWEDVLSRVNSILLESKDSNYIVRNHFLGAIVLKSIQRYGRQVISDEIIDGQQRITTLQLLFIALRDYLQSLSYDKYKTLLDRLTSNQLLLETESEKYKVWPTKIDQEIYEAIFTACSIDQVNSIFPLYKKPHSRYYEPRHKLVEAYVFFYSSIEKFIGNEKNAKSGARRTLIPE